jgi:hypothetical protein
METAYYGTPSNYSFTSLVIRDHNFIQLRDPFPYFTSASNEKSYESPEVKWTIAGSVDRLNKRLHRYYLRASR